MDEVPGANREGIAVAADRDHGQFGIGVGDAGRCRQNAAMQGVIAIGADIVLQGPRTADAGHDDDVVLGNGELGYRPFDGALNAEIAATSTPDRFGGGIGLGHKEASCSRMKSTRSTARNGVPSNLRILTMRSLGAPPPLTRWAN